jgi:hypothetical protein
MTEEEAINKKCPLFCLNPNELNLECIASDCMMWREIKTNELYEFDSEGKNLRVTRAPKVLGGYCGIGGKP